MGSKQLYSTYKEVNGFLYTSGQLPVNHDTGDLVEGIEKQTYQSLNNIKQVLDTKNYTLKDIVKLQIYFTSLEDYEVINEVYEKFFEELEIMPTRTAVVVNNLPRKALVEIDCIASKS